MFHNIHASSWTLLDTTDEMFLIANTKYGILLHLSQQIFYAFTAGENNNFFGNGKTYCTGNMEKQYAPFEQP